MLGLGPFLHGANVREKSSGRKLCRTNRTDLDATAAKHGLSFRFAESVLEKLVPPSHEFGVLFE